MLLMFIYIDIYIFIMRRMARYSLFIILYWQIERAYLDRDNIFYNVRKRGSVRRSFGP